MTTSLDLPEIAARFDRDGFVIVPELFAGRELEELRANVDRLLDGEMKPTPGNGGDTSPPDDFTTQWEPTVRDRDDIPRRHRVRVVFHLAHNHPYFWSWATNPRLLDIAEALLGPSLNFYTDQMFVKPAHHGSEVPWHQDAAYWPAVEPRMISCWVALDDVTEANGCVRFVPGSHRRAIEHREFDVPHGNTTGLGDDQVDASREVPAVMPAGSVCIHHSLAVHRSMPNTSDAWRRGWVLIYMPADLCFFKPWPFEYGFKRVRG